MGTPKCTVHYPRPISVSLPAKDPVPDARPMETPVNDDSDSSQLPWARSRQTIGLGSAPSAGIDQLSVDRVGKLPRRPSLDLDEYRLPAQTLRFGFRRRHLVRADQKQDC